ncbi:MAG TPA: creatininase family protein [Spirochaetota bacterium]|nr:creatininase family protein [Spirochaetota bacterium]
MRRITGRYISIRCAVLCAALLLLASVGTTQTAETPLLLQEMTWPDVKAYLQRCDMVIIPLGSIEQHGPHLPLGADTYEAYEMSKMISAKTGVVVAKVLSVGYSESHMGFPGTITISQETMERVLKETAESLIRHGFRKIMFFNYHGGNNLTQSRLVAHINRTTPATAVAIGIGGPIPGDVPPGTYDKNFDWHAGVGETSLMMYLKPDLVRKGSIRNPDIHFSEEVLKIQKLAEKYPLLSNVWHARVGTHESSGKGGATHEFSSNGIWSLSDVTKASADLGQRRVAAMVKSSVDFIHAWKELGRVE